MNRVAVLKLPPVFSKDLYELVYMQSGILNRYLSTGFAKEEKKKKKVPGIQRDDVKVVGGAIACDEKSLQVCEKPSSSDLQRPGSCFFFFFFSLSRRCGADRPRINPEEFLSPADKETSAGNFCELKSRTPAACARARLMTKAVLELRNDILRGSRAGPIGRNRGPGGAAR